MLASLKKKFRKRKQEEFSLKGYYFLASDELLNDVEEHFQKIGVDYIAIWKRVFPKASYVSGLPRYDDKLGRPVHDSLFILDTKVVWFFSLSWLLYHNLSVDDDHVSTRRAASIALFKIYTDYLAYRSLFVSNLSVQADGFVRIISQAVDIALLALIDQEFSKAYSEARTDDEANHVWHQYLARNKAKKALKRFMGYKESDEKSHSGLIDWESDFERESGMSIHSSFMRGFEAFSNFFEYERPSINSIELYTNSTRSLNHIDMIFLRGMSFVFSDKINLTDLVGQREIAEEAVFVSEYDRVFNSCKPLVMTLESWSRVIMPIVLGANEENEDT